MVKARINKFDCVLFYDERIPAEKAPHGYPYVYHLRHAEDDWTCPVNIEKFVLVNFFGTIFTNEPINWDSGDYIEITHFDMEPKYIKFKLKRNLFKRMLRI